MVNHMVQKSNNALVPDRKMWVYSAHDDTVANMLMTLDLFEPHCPPYATVLSIELKVNLKNEYFVKVRVYKYQMLINTKSDFLYKMNF